MAHIRRYAGFAGADRRLLHDISLWCDELALALLIDLGRVDAVVRTAMARELDR